VIAKAMHDTHWEFLEDNDVQEIVYSVLSTIALIDKTELLTVTAGKIARKLEGTYLECVELAASLLGTLSDTDVIDIELRGKYLVIVTHYMLPEDIKQYIVDTCYLPPMLVQPDEVLHGGTSGHLSFTKTLILKGNKHDLPLNYHATNRLNSVKFVLDERMLELEEESSKELDTQQKRESFARNLKAYNLAYVHLIGRPFHFTSNYDCRGRTYCGGWQVNYQGTDYKKSILSLAHKELIPLD
jgi:hypothetical protein